MIHENKTHKIKQEITKLKLGTMTYSTKWCLPIIGTDDQMKHTATLKEITFFQSDFFGFEHLDKLTKIS